MIELKNANNELVVIRFLLDGSVVGRKEKIRKALIESDPSILDTLD
jgi:hypothetical protein